MNAFFLHTNLEIRNMVIIIINILVILLMVLYIYIKIKSTFSHKLLFFCTIFVALSRIQLQRYNKITIELIPSMPYSQHFIESSLGRFAGKRTN